MTAMMHDGYLATLEIDEDAGVIGMPPVGRNGTKQNPPTEDEMEEAHRKVAEFDREHAEKWAASYLKKITELKGTSKAKGNPK